MGSVNIELDQKFLDNFYGMADMMPPNPVTIESLNETLNIIKEKISNSALQSLMLEKPELIPTPAASSSSFPSSSPSPMSFPTGGSGGKTVLVVDDLGIITYQLEMLFKKMNYDVVISKEINDAIDKFKKQDFDYAVLDLFIPTDREGFILLDEIKKLVLLCKLNTKIIIMTATSREEFRNKCLNRGADHYIEKQPGWQNELAQICR